MSILLAVDSGNHDICGVIALSALVIFMDLKRKCLAGYVRTLCALAACGLKKSRAEDRVLLFSGAVEDPRITADSLPTHSANGATVT